MSVDVKITVTQTGLQNVTFQATVDSLEAVYDVIEKNMNEGTVFYFNDGNGKIIFNPNHVLRIRVQV